MGKKLDALLGRTFKAVKFKRIVNLAISRVAVLKNQRHARLRQARSDVLQLIQLGDHERAVLRVEHVIKEQNMLDVYDMIQGYCNLLIERVHLIEQERECPGELKEAASGLIYVASRCGDFPEIQEIRSVLTSRFGKEFASRAIELRNNCGVHPLMIQKLSTRMPSLESRIKALKQIASENSIVLQLGEASSVLIEEQFSLERQNQHEQEIREESLHILPNGEDRQKYKDVADAVQAAFESAAHAAAAAKAAMELCRSEPNDPDDHSSTGPRPRKVLDGYDSAKVMSQLEDKEILSENQEEFKKNTEYFEKPKDILTSNSGEEILKGDTMLVDAETEVDPFEKELVFDESDNESDNIQERNQFSKQISSRFYADMEVGSGSRQLVLNAVSGSKLQSAPHLDLEKRPSSVRSR